MTIKNSNEDGQTLYVKRYITERWFSRIVGPLSRSYVKVALKLKVKLTCWKDRARNQSDCGTKPFQTFRKNYDSMSHDRYCKSEKAKEVGKVPLESNCY